MTVRLYRGQTTTLQMLNILKSWTKIVDEGNQVDVIYLDLKKVFDKVPHKRLIKSCEPMELKDESWNG